MSTEAVRKARGKQKKKFIAGVRHFRAQFIAAIDELLFLANRANFTDPPSAERGEEALRLVKSQLKQLSLMLQQAEDLSQPLD